MKVAIIGAAGRTGRHVVEQALARGHEVVAVVRRPGALSASDQNLTVAQADVLEAGSLVGALVGCEALVSTLGVGTSRAATNLYSRGITNELEAMATNRIRKIAVISAAPAGSRAQQPFFERRIAMPILDLLFGSTYEDMRRMEETLRTSEASWVSLRAPRLLEKPATGAYRLDTRPLSKARTLTYPDLAAALLDSLANEALHQQAAYVAN